MSQSDVNAAYKAYQDAQNQLSAAEKDLANKQNMRNSYSNNTAKEQEFLQKENAYKDAQNAYDAQVAATANAQLEYNRYFGAGGTKLDPSNGTPLATEPLPGQFSPSHADVKEAYEKAQQTLMELEKKLNTAKSNYLNIKSAQENANNQSVAYQAISAEVVAAEANVNTLRGTVDNLKNTYEKALQAHSSTVNTADSTIANMQDSVKNSELTSELNEETQKSQLKVYQDQLKEGILTSTVNGIVKSVSAKPGDVYAGTAIAVIAGVEEFVIESEISEYDIADIKEGMKVLIKTDSTRDEELKGRITYVSATATDNTVSAMTGTTAVASSNATYKVKITLDAQNDRLRLGMNAKLSIITDSRENVWTVPYEAVHEKEDGTKYIEILKDEQTKEKEELKVTTGLESSYYVEISSNKLTNGMKVVMPEVEADNSMEAIVEMMGADAGV